MTNHHDQESALAQVDILARRYVEAAAPIRFDVAQSRAELESVYRLRYRVAVDRGWAAPADLPAGLERDEYDDQSVQIAGWDGEALIATLRIILPSPGSRLPTESLFDLDIEPRGQVVEISRATVIPAYSDIQHRLFANLLARTWLEVRARGFSQACTHAALPLLRLYRFIGLRFTELGPARLVWNVERYPICFDMPASSPHLLRRLGRLLEQPIRR